MIIYISGPISGIPGNNREAFLEREKELIKANEGYNLEIINPIKIASKIDYENISNNYIPAWEDYMRACIKELCRATHITFLPGYEKSKGAMLEKEIAEKLGVIELKRRDDNGF